MECSAGLSHEENTISVSLHVKIETYVPGETELCAKQPDGSYRTRTVVNGAKHEIFVVQVGAVARSLNCDLHASFQASHEIEGGSLVNAREWTRFGALVSVGWLRFPVRVCLYIRMKIIWEIQVDYIHYEQWRI